MINKWRVISLVLAICLAISVGFNVYLCLVFTKPLVSGLQIFSWSDKEGIRLGTFFMVVSLGWENETVSMTVVVNDDEYNDWDYLGLVLDRNHNGKIDRWQEDQPYALSSNNMSRAHVGLGALGHLVFPEGDTSRPSPYHTCTYKEGVGHTYQISLKTSVRPPTVMLICFMDHEKCVLAPRTETIASIEFWVKDDLSLVPKKYWV